MSVTGGFMAEILEWGRLGVSALALLFSVATFFYMLYDKQQRATVQAFEAHKAAIEKRMTTVENDLVKIPSRAELDATQERWRTEIVRIHDRVDEINKGIKDSQLMIGTLIGLSKGANKHD